MSNIIQVDSSKFDKFYGGSYYTIIGAGGNLDDWFKGYNELFARESIGNIKQMYSFSGKDMNEYYGLTNDNRYPDDLVFLCFSLEELNIEKLAFIRLVMYDKWFDDIVDNNLRSEQLNGKILN